MRKSKSKIDHRKRMCPRCGQHVGLAALLTVRGQEMCEPCGQKEAMQWNQLIEREAACPKK